VNAVKTIGSCSKTITGGRLLEFLVVVVFLKGCAVRFWKLLFCLGLPHPPCNCTGMRGKKKTDVKGQTQTETHQRKESISKQAF